MGNSHPLRPEVRRLFPAAGGRVGAAAAGGRGGGCAPGMRRKACDDGAPHRKAAPLCAVSRRRGRCSVPCSVPCSIRRSIRCNVRHSVPCNVRFNVRHSVRGSYRHAVLRRGLRTPVGAIRLTRRFGIGARDVEPHLEDIGNFDQVVPSRWRRCARGSKSLRSSVVTVVAEETPAPEKGQHALHLAGFDTADRGDVPHAAAP